MAAVWASGFALLWLFAALFLPAAFVLWWVATNLHRPRIGTVVLGAWAAAPLSALAVLHWTVPAQEAGLWRWSPVLLALVPLWAGDTAAYFVGKAIGRHKLAPRISPGKTWEGTIANFALCVAVAALLGQWLGIELWRYLAVGAVLGVLGQVGDLFESALKRVAKVKDSGTLLPGHGGLLDRIDSLLFTAIPVALILAWPG
jgi:phosphatidate cytidylyltransferase